MNLLIKIFICLIAFVSQGCFNCKEYLEDDIIPLYIEGKIVAKYVDYKNHSTRTIEIINNKNMISYMGLHDFYADEIWNYVQVNDILYKEENSSVMSVDRNGVVKKFTLSCANQY